MRTRFVSLIGLVVLALAPAVEAQPLPERLLARFGETVDLGADRALRDELALRGVIASTANSVRIDRAFLTKLAGNEAFWNEVRRVRYRVGDRVFVRTTNEQGEERITHRAEIARIEDGIYVVNVWDPPATKTSAASHVERTNVRAVRVSHAELDSLNGFVDPGHGADYTVFGIKDGLYASYGPDVDLVSPSKDEALRSAVAWSNARVDDLIASGKLVLSLAGDRAKALEEIARVQRDLIAEFFGRFNVTGEPGYPSADAASVVDGRRLVGSYFRTKLASCTPKAEWMTAILREVGRRAGFDVRGTRTTLHSAMTIRTADGERFMMDPHQGVVLAPLDDYDRNFVRFADAGPLPVDRTTFLDEAARIELRRGVAPDFASRLAARERAPRSPGLAEALTNRVEGETRDRVSADER